MTPPVDPEVIRVLEQVTRDLISIEDAARRLGWLESGEARTCGTCKYFKGRQCHRPNQPARPEHPDSVCCQEYEFDDPRDYAMLNEAKPQGSKMWK